MRIGPPCTGSSGLPSYRYAKRTSSSAATEYGTLALYPFAPCVTTKATPGCGAASLTISANGTPSHVVSNLVQRVTQWMSVFTTFVGSAVNWSQVSSNGFSTSPKTRKRHVFGLNVGIAPTCNTG